MNTKNHLGKFSKVYRHGDVIIFRLDQANLEAFTMTPVNKLVLAYGEVTGHAHRLAGEVNIAANAPEAGIEPVLFEVINKAVLTHEEHDTIVLNKGVYLKVNQVEYDPFKDLVVAIRD